MEATLGQSRSEWSRACSVIDLDRGHRVWATPPAPQLVQGRLPVSTLHTDAVGVTLRKKT